MKLKINFGKSELLVVKRDQRKSCEKVRVRWEEMEGVDKFTHLGLMISADRGIGEEGQIE